MHVSALAISLTLALTSAVSAHSPDIVHRRHHARVVSAAQDAPLVVREFAGAGRNDSNPVEPSSSGVTSTGTSQTSSSSSSSSSTTDSSSPTSSPTSSSASTETTSSVSPTTSSDQQTSSTPSSSSSSTSSEVPLSTPSSQTSSTPTLTNSVTNAPPATIQPQLQTTVITTTQSTPSLVTGPSASVTGTTNNLNSNGNGGSSGLSKPALIAIIIVAVVVGAAIIGWTLFRKFKLKKSSKFNNRFKSIDFGPSTTLHDDFFEKTLPRSNSTSGGNQRNLLVSEIDTTNHVAGIPEHDFTADATNQQQPGVYDMYNQDPYYHAEAYEYGASYGQQADPSQGYAVSAGMGAYGAPAPADQLTQDHPVNNNGYADLQRGNSNGSGSGHGHTHAHTVQQHQPQVFPNEFPDPGQYLGRPTGHGEGPYAQAAVYRTY